MRKHEIIALGSTIALGTLAFAHPGFEPVEIEQVRAATARERTVASPELFELPPLEMFGELVERPLFEPTRRPVPAAVPPAEELAKVADAASPSGKKVAFKLTGVVIDGVQGIALIAHTGRVDRVRTGEAIVGWRLEKIESERVVLDRGTEKVELQLRSFEHNPNPRGSTNTVAAGQTVREHGDALELTDEEQELLEPLFEEGDKDILELLSEEGGAPEETRSLRPLSSEK